MSPEPARRRDLIDATIQEIGASGTLNVSVSTIARRAGMSSALAFHYFGDKETMFLAAIRHVLSQYGAEVRRALHGANGHEARLSALIGASFAPANFQPATISAWMNFYVMAQTSTAAHRLLSVYQRRLRSNLLYDLRPLSGAGAPEIAERLAGLIDGLYLRAALHRDRVSGTGAAQLVLTSLTQEIEAHRA